MTITIAPATPSDAEALAKVQIAAFHSDSLGYAKMGEEVRPDITLFAYEKRA
jgi:hypothetical protein